MTCCSAVLKIKDFRCLVYTTQQKRAIYHIERAVSYIWLAEGGNTNVFIVTLKYHSVKLMERPWAEVEGCANKDNFFLIP
jgi:hypothetical protein